MTMAVSYLRCSGDAQKLGDTWERQQEAVRRYAASNSIEVVAEFRDEGITGKMELEGRSGLSQCMEYIQTNDIKMVIVESSDRLARDSIVAEVLVREFQKIDVTVISASGGVNLTEGDDSNPTAKLIRQILAAIAEFDRCVTVLKLRGARDRIRKATGKCEGRSAFGEKDGEKQTVELMLWLHRSGYSPEAISSALNQRGILTRYRKNWRGTTVGRIIERHNSKQLVS